MDKSCLVAYLVIHEAVILEKIEIQLSKQLSNLEIVKVLLRFELGLSDFFIYLYYKLLFSKFHNYRFKVWGANHHRNACFVAYSDNVPGKGASRVVSA